MTSLVYLRSTLHYSYWALILLLTACVTPPVLTENELTNNMQTFTGRFAVTYESQAHTQREQGRFEWRVQTPAMDAQQTGMTLLLLSPLGHTVAVMQDDPTRPAFERATFKTPTANYQAPSLEQLMNQVLGWSIPLSTLLPYLLQNVPPKPLDDWRFEVVSRYENNKPKVVLASNTPLSLQVRLVFDE